jgi:hypothetical protein
MSALGGRLTFGARLYQPGPHSGFAVPSKYQVCNSYSGKAEHRDNQTMSDRHDRWLPATFAGGHVANGLHESGVPGTGLLTMADRGP